MSEYDAILGIEWLSTHAVINCQKKRMLFKWPNGEKFEFKGTSRSKLTISALKGKRLLESGCYGYLANIVDKTKEDKTGLKDIPIVREYVMVFPEDLMNLLPDR